MQDIAQEIYAIVGREFNIDSDAELATVLYDEMGLPPVAKDQHGYRVDDDALWPLINDPLVALIWDYRNAQIAQRIPASAAIVEEDWRGRIVGWGSHADYDIYAEQVMNGEGYYDENGRYHSYNIYD